MKDSKRTKDSKAMKKNSKAAKKILFNTSPGSFKSPGGGEIQLLETKKELENLGFEVKILEEQDYAVDFSEFDLFHNFNIHRDNYPFVMQAEKAGIPIAVSTIYWPSLKSAILWNKGVKGKGKAVAAELAKRIGISKAKQIVRTADVLLPNSKAEANVLKKIFHADERKIHIVRNGVDARFAKAKPEVFEKRFGLKNFVLYVGRIEERKNVLSLIKAMKGVNEKLVIIGGPTSNSSEYYKKCLEVAGKDVVFLKPMLHNDELLSSAYAACRVFALPSWYETPGLAALEAGLAGADIIITQEGCTKEYFENYALYVNPGRISDIREKIEKILVSGSKSGLRKHIEKKFLWKAAAKQTAAAYASILGD